MSKIKPVYLLYAAWTISLIGMVGSLIMSDIVGWVPCVLCWYQRIALYPLVLIIATGILRHDRSVAYYILPFSFVGSTIAFYHWLLQIGVIKETLSPCSLGVSCITNYFNYGFINIPFLSLAAFVMISLLSLSYIKLTKIK